MCESRYFLFVSSDEFVQRVINLRLWHRDRRRSRVRSTPNRLRPRRRHSRPAAAARSSAAIPAPFASLVELQGTNQRFACRRYCGFPVLPDSAFVLPRVSSQSSIRKRPRIVANGESATQIIAVPEASKSDTSSRIYIFFYHVLVPVRVPVPAPVPVPVPVPFPCQTSLPIHVYVSLNTRLLHILVRLTHTVASLTHAAGQELTA